ncbi:DUF3048 domain-containing protein [Streptomyces lancefieldiae]|uniref:DUF3048 domain-containing protein n=1 Tax=Streptomyces lancefieldiae TaxID=3075520 RepID=A0ABU3AEY1_9ACTN|nr:DUF3048 domain-containing protein [Streptomyces sp. DSM 40712]MDT0608740.1 DUF3048 domain-containing protein [Streptomyces sp. DSM 40712]
MVGMRRGTRRRDRAVRHGTRVGTGPALLAAAVAVSLAAGCTAGSGAEDDARAPHTKPSHDTGRPQDTQRHGTPPPRDAHGTASVLAVKLDNVPAARPQAGLDAADVVYVEPVEGGLSRLMAIYATELPEVVGPVRSARESDLELLRQFDRPTLAFSGAQRKLLPLIDRAPLRAEPPDRTSDAYVRHEDRPAPHNLYVRPGRLLPSPAGPAALTTGFHHGEAPAGGRPQSSRTVRYPSASFTFTWSEGRGRWLVTMDGSPAPATASAPAPATVVVQHVKVHESAFGDFRGNNSPYVESVGSGRAEVLRDGRAYEATWKRRSAADGTSFTAPDGAPVNFADGQVWVVFAKTP